MIRLTPVVRTKHPVVFHNTRNKFTAQFKHILNKKPLHYFQWDPLPQYPPRQLEHANRKLCPHTGAELLCAHRWANVVNASDSSKVAKTAIGDPDERSLLSTYLVPDQHFGKIPVPSLYRDAYWHREQQSRRTQLPLAEGADRAGMLPHKDADGKDRRHLAYRYDLQDWSFREKQYFNEMDVIRHAKRDRR